MASHVLHDCEALVELRCGHLFVIYGNQVTLSTYLSGRRCTVFKVWGLLNAWAKSYAKIRNGWGQGSIAVPALAVSILAYCHMISLKLNVCINTSVGGGGAGTKWCPAYNYVEYVFIFLRITICWLYKSTPPDQAVVTPTNETLQQMRVSLSHLVSRFLASLPLLLGPKKMFHWGLNPLSAALINTAMVTDLSRCPTEFGTCSQHLHTHSQLYCKQPCHLFCCTQSYESHVDVGLSAIDWTTSTAVQWIWLQLWCTQLHMWRFSVHSNTKHLHALKGVQQLYVSPLGD
jgi:hypothetical protein